MLKVYSYKNCSTCQKALKYLQLRGVEHQVIPIVEQPPGRDELRRMAGYVGWGKLFNTSGQVYRELGLSGRKLSEEETLDLLAKNGKLLKRPFVLGDSWGGVGFKQEDWDRLLEF